MLPGPSVRSRGDCNTPYVTHTGWSDAIAVPIMIQYGQQNDHDQEYYHDITTRVTAKETNAQNITKIRTKRIGQPKRYDAKNENIQLYLIRQNYKN